MPTELILNGNYENDEAIWELIKFDGETVTAPDGYIVRQSGDDVIVIDPVNETMCHCSIVDSDFVK